MFGAKKNQDSILEGLSSSRNVKIDEITGPEFKKKAESNATFRKMAAICKKYNYRLYIAYKRRWKEGGPAEVDIQINAVERYNQPDITYDGHYGGPKQFEINASSSGFLVAKDFEAYIKKQQDALNLVKELEKIDFDTLEESPVTYD